MVSDLNPLFDRKYECKICKQTFTTKKLRSKFIKVASYDSDFMPNYTSEEVNPLLYHVNVCPICGFSSTDDFSPYFAPGTLEDLYAKVCNHWQPHDFGGVRTIPDAIKTYKLAIYCSQLKREKHILQAGLCIRTAWLYRLLDKTEEEMRFMRLATKEYLTSYETDDYRGTQVSDVRILFLIAERSYRIGEIEQCIRFLSKIMELRKSSTESGLIEKAKERWQQIREERANTGDTLEDFQ